MTRSYPPTYTFLTTGIAGSVTTFSSWMLEGFLAFSNEDQYTRGGFHDVSVAARVFRVQISHTQRVFGFIRADHHRPSTAWHTPSPHG